MTEETVLVLRTCHGDMSSFGGFIWPREGYVEAPDWDPTPECGNGLHGLLRGVGSGTYLDWDHGSVWLVVEVLIKDIVDLGGKVKFPKGKVLYAGDRQTAINMVHSAYPGLPIVGIKREVDDGEMVAGGYRSELTGGDYSTITGGAYSTLRGGQGAVITGGTRSIIQAEDDAVLTGHRISQIRGENYCTITGASNATVNAGYSCKIQVDYNSRVNGGKNSLVTARERGFIRVGHESRVYAGEECEVHARNFSRIHAEQGSAVKAGEYCVVFAGVNTAVMGKNGTVIHFDYPDLDGPTKTLRPMQVRTVVVGRDVEPGKVYRCGGDELRHLPWFEFRS